MEKSEKCVLIFFQTEEEKIHCGKVLSITKAVKQETKKECEIYELQIHEGNLKLEEEYVLEKCEIKKTKEKMLNVLEKIKDNEIFVGEDYIMSGKNMRIDKKDILHDISQLIERAYKEDVFCDEDLEYILKTYMFQVLSTKDFYSLQTKKDEEKLIIIHAILDYISKNEVMAEGKREIAKKIISRFRSILYGTLDKINSFQKIESLRIDPPEYANWKYVNYCIYPLDENVGIESSKEVKEVIKLLSMTRNNFVLLVGSPGFEDEFIRKLQAELYEIFSKREKRIQSSQDEYTQIPMNIVNISVEGYESDVVCEEIYEASQLEKIICCIMKTGLLLKRGEDEAVYEILSELKSLEKPCIFMISNEEYESLRENSYFANEVFELFNTIEVKTLTKNDFWGSLWNACAKIGDYKGLDLTNYEFVKLIYGFVFTKFKAHTYEALNYAKDMVDNVTTKIICEDETLLSALLILASEGGSKNEVLENVDTEKLTKEKESNKSGVIKNIIDKAKSKFRRKDSIKNDK